ncbi:MAG: SOS response-associated peptidase [Phycisphaeraceae bacterium]|nr:SOS response-associated peptidase [Phycisphaeraceae bacterium]
MCGRISLKIPAYLLAEIFGVPIPPELAPRYNIAPTQRTLIIRSNHRGREATLARWGYIPSWRKADEKGPEPINARSESATTSRLFAGAMRARRCVVPASGFYEWQAQGASRSKQPFHIEPAQAHVFALAGLWARWEPLGSTPLDTFTILTCAPNKVMAPIHDRMPVILPPEVIDGWLDPAIDDVDTVAQMLRPAPESTMVARRVSTRVNNPKHDDPMCIEPEAAREGPTPPSQPRAKQEPGPGLWNQHE